MSDAIDILTNYIDRQWSQAQQSENQRATITNYILVIVAALQALIAQRSFDMPSLALAVFIALLGVFGMVTSAKYYERFRCAASHAGRAMERLHEVCPDVDLDEIESRGKASHLRRYPHLARVRLNWLWLGLHTIIILVGVVNVVIICVWGPVSASTV